MNPRASKTKLAAKKQGAVTQGISFGTREFLDAVKRRAKSRRRSLSAHICDLGHDDLDAAEPKEGK